MKHQTNPIYTISLAAILGCLSATAAANAGEASGPATTQHHAVTSERLPDEVQKESRERRAESQASRLSPEQMDQVYGGMISNDSPPPVPQYGSDGVGVTCRHLSCYGL